MLVDVKVPVLSESVTEATLLTWHRKTGERVGRNENLVDVETDKVILELPAPATGTLARILKQDGATVAGGEVIATIETEIEAKAQTEAGIEAGAAPAPDSPPSGSSPDALAPAPVVMPAARHLAAEAGLGEDDMGAIQGSGRGGRIVKGDVAAYIKDRSVQPAAPAATPDDAPGATPPTARPAVAGGNRSDRRVPMSRLRARIAQRLVQSQSTAAILTTFNEVNMQAIMDLRARHRDRFEKMHGVKLGLTSFFVKAAVAALKQFPIVNASVEGDDILYHDYFDIGIAVSSPRGLVVPVIRDADALTQAQIEKQVADFGRRATEGKLTLEDLTGGTFSITNGGVFGSLLSTPIINPPQSAILGIHATRERPVAENGQVVIRPMTYLALSYDHRIIDGREAVLSLVAMKEALEYPGSPLLEA